jgi:hypothetical protein
MVKRAARGLSTHTQERGCSSVGGLLYVSISFEKCTRDHFNRLYIGWGDQRLLPEDDVVQVHPGNVVAAAEPQHRAREPG